MMVSVLMALGSSIAAVALWFMVGGVDAITVDGECADGAGKQHSSSSVMVGKLFDGVTVDGEFAEGAGKQHSSRRVMVGELMVLLWMVSVQMALGSSIAAAALWLVS